MTAFFNRIQRLCLRNKSLMLLSYNKRDSFTIVFCHWKKSFQGISHVIFSVPIYKDSLSPFFDNAKYLLCVHVTDKIELDREVKDLSKLNTIEKVFFIKDLKPRILVCNAISWFWYNYLTYHKITIYPFLCGDIDDIINRLKENSLEKLEYSLE